MTLSEFLSPLGYCYLAAAVLNAVIWSGIGIHKIVRSGTAGADPVPDRTPNPTEHA